MCNYVSGTTAVASTHYTVSFKFGTENKIRGAFSQFEWERIPYGRGMVDVEAKNT